MLPLGLQIGRQQLIHQQRGLELPAAGEALEVALEARRFFGWTTVSVEVGHWVLLKLAFRAPPTAFAATQCSRNRRLGAAAPDASVAAQPAAAASSPCVRARPTHRLALQVAVPSYGIGVGGGRRQKAGSPEHDLPNGRGRESDHCDPLPLHNGATTPRQSRRLSAGTPTVLLGLLERFAQSQAAPCAQVGCDGPYGPPRHRNRCQLGVTSAHLQVAEHQQAVVNARRAGFRGHSWGASQP